MSQSPSEPRFALSVRAERLAIASRFVDELLGSTLQVLLPGIRVRLGLSYAAISLLKSANSYSEAISEPLTGLAIDVVSRRTMIAISAALLGLGGLALGLAPSMWVLTIGFVLTGLAGGPLRQTGDVVLLQGRRTSATRVAALVMASATAGGMAGPLAIRAWTTANADTRSLLVVIGCAACVYAVLAACTRFPQADTTDAEVHTSFLGTMRRNLRAVIRNRRAMSWLVFMRVFYVMDAPGSFETLWLADNAHMSEGAIAL